MCILIKDNYLICVQGTPNVFLKNEDFDKVLRNPKLAQNIKQHLSTKITTDIIIGRLGKEENGIYKEIAMTVDTTPNTGKELYFYECI